MTDLCLDLDGTLLDVSERYYRIYHDVMSNLGQPVLDKARYWEYKRSGLSESHIASRAAADGSVFLRYEQTREELLEGPSYLRFDQPVVPHLHQILADLSKRHHLYLVTLRKNRDLLDDQLKVLNLYDYFKAVLSPHQARPPDISSWMLKASLVRNAVCLQGAGTIVGDTEADILAGKAVGIRTYAVLSGLRNMAMLASLSPDALVQDVSELPGQL